MEVIERHEPYINRKYRFRCRRCESILEAKREELTARGNHYNETYYEFFCPVCKQNNYVGVDDITEIMEMGGLDYGKK